MKFFFGVLLTSLISLSPVAEANAFYCQKAYRKQIRSNGDAIPPMFTFFSGNAAVGMLLPGGPGLAGAYFLLAFAAVNGGVTYVWRKHLLKKSVQLTLAKSVIQESFAPDQDFARELYEKNFFKQYYSEIERKLLLEINPERLKRGEKTLVLEEYLEDHPGPAYDRNKTITPLEKVASQLGKDYDLVARRVRELSSDSTFCPHGKAMTVKKLTRLLKEVL